jgi:glycosyltransferase involved in cell wall biosynthesis
MNPDWNRMRVAIVHYWYVGFTGGERVVSALAEIFPQADLFALIAKPDVLPCNLRSRRMTTSFLQKIPGSIRWYRHFLPLQPIALEHLDVSGYDLILSSESGPAKGVISPARTCHICYCHSPMRYLWDMYHGYRKAMGPVRRAVFSAAAHYLRAWDLASAARVDYFAANSRNVASRIRKHYRRTSTVIYPPAAVEAATLPRYTEDYYLVVSRLIDYKRVDLAIEVCNRLQRHLRIVGDGDQYKSLRRLAGPTVEFLGHLPERELHACYAQCRALLFPGEEDFGIVPVEAQSFGRPVIAYERGGASETVIPLFSDGAPEISTGVFFDRQTSDAMIDAIQRFEVAECRFHPRVIQANAQRFSKPRFINEMTRFIDKCLADHRQEDPSIGGGQGNAETAAIQELRSVPA